jgi:flagellar hook assembly protein FlgD
LAAVVDDTLRILYESSFAGGSSLQDGSTITLDTMRYYQTPATVGVEEEAKGAKIPASFELGASRPNPTGAKTAIQYSLPAAVEVNLAVYNAAGQLVETLASGHRAAGVHTANWEVRTVPAGVYFYRLTAGKFTQTRSMVVVR